MGRSGGGGGGGFSGGSGGFSSGGRSGGGGGFSSGGRSGGGLSGGGLSGGSGGFSGGNHTGGGGFFGGGHHGHHHHHHPHSFWGFRMPWFGYGGGRRYYGGSGGGCGCSALIAILIGLIVIVSIVRTSVFDWQSSPDYSYDYVDDDYDSEYEPYIGESTWQRKAIDKSLSEETAWYQDDNGGEDIWINSPSALEDGLQYFFERTGVRPYLRINTQETSAEVLEMTDEERFDYVEEMYGELFTDDAHALFVISDDGNENWRYDDYIGAEALLVMDYEAINILYDCFDYYWTTDLEEEALFSNSFRDAADVLMGEETAADPEQDPEEELKPKLENDLKPAARPDEERETEPEKEYEMPAEVLQEDENQAQPEATQANVFSQIKDGIGDIADKMDQANVSRPVKNYIALALVLIIGAAAIAAVLAWRKKQDERERNR